MKARQEDSTCRLLLYADSLKGLVGFYLQRPKLTGDMMAVYKTHKGEDWDEHSLVPQIPVYHDDGVSLISSKREI